MATGMSKDYRLATDDEDAGDLHAWQEGTYEDLDDEIDEVDDEEEEGRPWLDEYDHYDFPEDDGDGLFDPMEKERP